MFKPYTKEPALIILALAQLRTSPVNKKSYNTSPQASDACFSFNAAWAAARRAIGTRKGEQET
jgi:hypothetical protein